MSIRLTQSRRLDITTGTIDRMLSTGVSFNGAIRDAVDGVIATGFGSLSVGQIESLFASVQEKTGAPDRDTAPSCDDDQGITCAACGDEVPSAEDLQFDEVLGGVCPPCFSDDGVEVVVVHGDNTSYEPIDHFDDNDVLVGQTRYDVKGHEGTPVEFTVEHRGLPPVALRNHQCPRCTETASGVDDIQNVFGFRRMTSVSFKQRVVVITTRKQSYCRECRKKERAEKRNTAA